MLGHTKGHLGQSGGHFELARRLGSFCAALAHGVAMVQPFRPPSETPRLMQNFLSLWLNAGA